MVDLKGIEPSNLTDANRALSQLSYRPIFNSGAANRENYYTTISLLVNSYFCFDINFFVILLIMAGK